MVAIITVAAPLDYGQRLLQQQYSSLMQSVHPLLQLEGRIPLDTNFVIDPLAIQCKFWPAWLSSGFVLFWVCFFLVV